MADNYPPTLQRATLLKLAESVGCTAGALRRDECGDWSIQGARGHIYAVPGVLAEGFRDRAGFLIYVDCGSYSAASRAWSLTRTDLAFATVINDGDTEGCLFLDRLPTSSAIIRKRVRIRKKREISDAERKRLRSVSGL